MIRSEEIKVPGYERVAYCEDSASGLRSIIAVHCTALGPSCGGIRLLPYKNRESALQDVLRLAKGMSYKSSLAGIGFGGGKSVIIGSPELKTRELFLKFGEFVNLFEGRYFAAKDMNINSDDLMIVRESTQHVLGIDGVIGSSGDPSPVTARGVMRSFEAVAEELGSRSLNGLRVALQGIGHVGFAVAEQLRAKGAELWVTDVNENVLNIAADELGAHVVQGDSIFDLDVDIFSPNACGAVLNQDTIQRLKVRAVVGAANNQLDTPTDGMRLYEKGILYAPDFVVNAGGIINIFVEFEGYNPLRAFEKTDGIYSTLKEIFARSKALKQAPFVIADQIAEERIHGSSR